MPLSVYAEYALLTGNQDCDWHLPRTKEDVRRMRAGVILKTL